MNVVTRPFLPSDRLEHEKVSAVAILGWVARATALASKTHHANAANWLADSRAPIAAQRIFSKAAIGAGSTTNSTLGPSEISIGQWSDSARTKSAFYRILADAAFVPAPLRSRVGIVTSVPTAGVTAEGRGIGVSRVTLNNVLLEPIKVGGLIVVTGELLLDVSAAGQQLFNRELISVISAGVDSEFVNKIDTGVTPINSTAALSDIRAAQLAVASDDLERPYWICSTDVGKLASTLSDTKGGPAFAAASAIGGEIGGIPLLISSGCPAGTLYYVNAAQIAANGEAPTVDVSSQADIQMDTAPTIDSTTPTPAALVSMFQTDSVALRSTAVFAAEKLRSSAVAVVSGITTTTWAP